MSAVFGTTSRTTPRRRISAASTAPRRSARRWRPRAARPSFRCSGVHRQRALGAVALPDGDLTAEVGGRLRGAADAGGGGWTAGRRGEAGAPDDDPMPIRRRAVPGWGVRPPEEEPVGRSSPPDPVAVREPGVPSRGRSAPGRTRTCDRQIRRLLLYPLSYGGAWSGYYEAGRRPSSWRPAGGHRLCTGFHPPA